MPQAVPKGKTPLSSPVPGPARRLAREQVYGQLLGWITDGTLGPEQVLRDAAIAEQLGVSRTPVREALRRLEDEGLVETALNRWTRVAPLNLAQAAELYPVIGALEDLALTLAAPQLTDADLALLDTLNARLHGALSAADAWGAVQADAAFHGVWTGRSGNTELQGTLAALKRKLQRVELAYFDLPSAAACSVLEHAAVLRALRAQDGMAARQALRQNWQGSLGRLQGQAPVRLP